jgi:predicted kinase
MSTLYMMVGIPGSGKSTFAKTLKGKYVSRDEVRFKLLQDGDDYFAKEGEVFQKFIYEIEEGLSRCSDVIVDATHLNKGSRYKLLSKVRPERVVAIVMDTSLDVCLQRNAQRSGRALVPEDVIRDMYQHMTIPNYDEGFDAIIMIKGGDK